MIFVSHRINTIKKLNKTPKFYGVEIDLRDYKKKIILSHDPFKSGESFYEFLKKYDHKFLILNVKNEGIELNILKILKKFKIKNYFFLDCTFPSLINLTKKGIKNIAIRVSDYESFHTLRNMKYLAKWVWIDCFKNIPLDEKKYKLIKKYKYKICLVSPELHRRKIGNRKFLKLVKSQKIKIDMLCTKQDFFENWKNIFKK
jgi:hypothetical protein|tara:strand:- start:14 stop:616 length:603 start_codon:yes stop_codon:yes gene_type:complete